MSNNEHKRIYFDQAASTPVSEEVASAMEPYLSEVFANAGGLYKEGLASRDAIAKARLELAEVLHARPDEIIFTSGATESNNLTIWGVVTAADKPLSEMHVITTTFEHKSALVPAKELESRGVQVTYLTPDKDGFISAKDLREALREETVLVSIMYANNEIGTVQSIKELARVVKTFKHEGGTSYRQYPYFFTDAAQAPGALPIATDSLGIDLMSLSGHKCYGPKGVGVLYKRRDTVLKPLSYGGDQEGGLRPGSEPTALIVGMAKALALIDADRESESAKQTNLRDKLISDLIQIPGLLINGHAENRLPGNVSFTVPAGSNLTGEQVVIELDARGFAVSTGSACDRDREGGSHVIMALGHDAEYAGRTVRLTFGKEAQEEDLTDFVTALKDVLAKYSQIH